jgi:prevent-host-death family protein
MQMDRDKPISVHQAKAHFSELLDRAHGGQEIVVSKKGRPWAKIVPLSALLRRELGFGIGVVDDAFFEPLPPGELAAWETPHSVARSAQASKTGSGIGRRKLVSRR